MGVVECERHGRLGGGPLLCDHLLDAVYRRRTDGAPEVVRFAVDPLDNGQHYLIVFVCGACASQAGVTSGAIVGGDALRDETRFPENTPACAACFTDWAAAVGLEK